MALPGTVRRQLDSMTRNIFNDVRRTVPTKSEVTEGREVDIVSSLPLQISLYFNTFYFPFWWICDVLTLQLKYILLPDHYKFILVTLLILMSVIEVIRLYLGYSGNLQEKRSTATADVFITPDHLNLIDNHRPNYKMYKVPELAGFWLLSILLQLPLLLFLLCDPGVEPLPLERASHGILTAFLLFQIPVSSLTLRKTTRRLAGRFHQLGNLEEHA